MRRVIPLTLLAAALVFVTSSGAAGGSGTLTPGAFAPGQSNVALSLSVPDCAGDGAVNEGSVLREDSGSAALDDVFYPNPPALNSSDGSKTFTGSGDVNPKAALGAHTLTFHCNGADHAVAVTVGSTATPVPTATPGGLPDFGTNPGNAVSIDPTTFPLDTDNVSATVTAHGCTADDVHLVDRVQEAANDERATGSAFNYLPTLLDAGEDGTAPDGDGVYPGGFNVNGTGQTAGQHTLDVICGAKAFGTVTITLQSGAPAPPHGATGKGPTNKAPSKKVPGGQPLRIGWTYATDDPYTEPHSKDLTIAFPACAAKGGTKLIWPAGAIYAAGSDSVPTLDRLKGTEGYRGPAYVGASIGAGDKTISGIKCVKNGKVALYGHVHVTFVRKLTSFAQPGTLTPGAATPTVVDASRCRDPKVTSLTVSDTLLSPHKTVFTRAGKTTFSGTEQSDPDVGAGVNQGTIACGSGQIGQYAITAG